jgi:hypothetical protein
MPETNSHQDQLYNTDQSIVDQMGSYDYAARVDRKDYQIYKDRLLLAERHLNKDFKPIYQQCDRIYNGRHYLQTRQKIPYSRVVHNITKQFIDTRIEAIAFAHPDIQVTALNEGMENNAEILKSVIDFYWRTLDFQDELRHAYADCEKYGVGMVYVCWDIQKGTEPVKGLPASVGQDDGVSANDPGAVYYPKTKDQPMVRHIHPLQFLMPPDSRRLKEARWCGFIDFIPRSELAKQFKLPRKVIGNRNTLHDYLTSELREMEDTAFPTDYRYCKVYHYFDRIERIHLIYVEGVDKPIYTGRWSWQGDYFPFAIIHDDDNSNNFYSTPLPKRMESLQKLVNKIYSKYADAVSHCGPALLLRRGEFDRGAKEQTQSDEWFRFIEHTSRDVSPVSVLPNPGIPNDLLNVEQKAFQGMRAASALSEFEAMTTLTKRLTAEETNAIQQGTGVRAAGAAQRFEKFCKTVTDILMDLILVHLTDELTLPIFDQAENPKGFVTFNQQEYNQAKFMASVYVGSTQIRTNMDRVKDIAYLIQTLEPFAQLVGPDGQPLIHFDVLLRELLKLIPDLRHVNEVMAPPAPAALNGLNLPPTASSGIPAGVLPAGMTLEQLQALLADLQRQQASAAQQGQAGLPPTSGLLPPTTGQFG